MNVNHLISDTIARIKNGFVGRKNTVSVLKSKQTSRIIEILEQEGFIRGYLDNKNTITVQLKYLDGKSVIHNFKVISTPGERMYFGFKDLIDWKNETNSFHLSLEHPDLRFPSRNFYQLEKSKCFELKFTQQ